MNTSLYKEVYLDPNVIALIKEHCLNFFSEHNKEKSYSSLNPNFSMELKQLINNALNSYNLPNMDFALFFRKRNYYDYGTGVHRDYLGPVKDNISIHCGLNIPLEGTKGTIHYWLGGEYTEEIGTVPNGNEYTSMNWKNGFTVLDRVEIHEHPVFLKTDIPHGITSINRDYRSIVSIRFEGNPTYEELVDKFIPAKLNLIDNKE